MSEPRADPQTHNHNDVDTVGDSQPVLHQLNLVIKDMVTTLAFYRRLGLRIDVDWGARYAIVEDPDGNGVGLMSPIDPERKYWPPRRPPAAS